MSLFTAIFIKDPMVPPPLLKFFIENYSSAVFWNVSFKTQKKGILALCLHDPEKKNTF